jgi:chromosome segregation ATPase
MLGPPAPPASGKLCALLPLRSTGTSETLEFALLARLREVLAGAPASEVELRKLSEQTDAWARTLAGQLRASEARLAALVGDSESSLAAMADELRRIEALRPELRDLRARIEELEVRARQLRTGWLLEQTASDAPHSEAPTLRRS